MRLIAMKPIRMKTSKGTIDILQGETFNPVNAKPLIEAGVAIPITQEIFKGEFKKLAAHLKQQFMGENMARLQELAYKMDEAWDALDYPAFWKAIDAMMAIEGTPDTLPILESE